jgi:hypothetical protein
VFRFFNRLFIIFFFFFVVVVFVRRGNTRSFIVVLGRRRRWHFRAWLSNHRAVLHRTFRRASARETVLASGTSACTRWYASSW